MISKRSLGETYYRFMTSQLKTRKHPSPEEFEEKVERNISFKIRNGSDNESETEYMSDTGNISDDLDNELV